ncbi:related to PAC2 - microtubule effector required for tubulin heterodimer formation [Ustilago trichophora]|uniref:Related to PAC2 - microtubule effector required for tubulin heterodimer formation n=1 Tax=Ustilago trichophora TaxID=86804 RepID=A0A5C3DT44_9BASI|nr:related to PAC2 - microtubule effector required for tubulin heterodimer formation [Ustilago trichophora]
MSLSVGQRISLGAHRGTIRYRGPVPPSTGEWLGIEWDDPTRGKHDGQSSDGTRYFHVRVAGSGSFIRPTASKLSSGCCFLEALKNKYLPPFSEGRPKQEPGEKQQYTRKTIADIEIETPNMDRIAAKSSRLDRLKEVGLGGWNQNSLVVADTAEHDPRYDVARAFDEEKEGYGEGWIRKTCPNIRWLDLSRSLLPNWEEVSLIVGELERLKTLLLHFCRFERLTEEKMPESWVGRFEKLQDLRLDGTLMGWEEVRRLAPALIGLRHLQLGSNGIESLRSEGEQEKDAILPSLTSLSLEDNALSTWPDLIGTLSPLPALESLNLNHNLLTSIPAPPPSAIPHPTLDKLCELHLRGNHLDSWISLENISSWLGHSTSLTSLHISSLPLNDYDDEETHQPQAATAEEGLLGRYEYRDFRAITIARLPSLLILDKTEITPKERKDAELFVYTRFRDGDASIIHGSSQRGKGKGKVELSEEEKSTLFPRYLELAKRFDGESTHEEEKRGKRERNTLRSKMIGLKVSVAENAPRTQWPHLEGGQKEIEVKILASTPMRLVKVKLANAVGVKMGHVGQIWALLKQHNGDESKDEDGEKIVLEVDDMSRSLDWYEVSSGDQLVLVVES